MQHDPLRRGMLAFLLGGALAAAIPSHAGADDHGTAHTGSVGHGKHGGGGGGHTIDDQDHTDTHDHPDELEGDHAEGGGKGGKGAEGAKGRQYRGGNELEDRVFRGGGHDLDSAFDEDV